jgi:hypothetical protein
VSRAWVLNLDADRELALGPAYTPSNALRRQLHEHAAALAETLPSADVWIEDDGDPRGLAGRCWCPTPRALARLAEVGARPPASAPSVDILRRVNGRTFSSALHALEGQRRIDDPRDAHDVLRAGSWIVHREHTFAGRGHRFVEGPPSDADLAWIAKGLRLGPLHAAPRLAIELEVALHGHLGPGGIERGVVTVQHVEGTQWRGSARAPDVLSSTETRAFAETFDQVAAALRSAGYGGPFGIDAFRHAAGFHPLSELNARYSMGYAVGMGRW